MRHILAPALALALCTPALAAFDGPGGIPAGGFSGPSSSAVISTVTQAMQAPDEACCVLEGKITSRGPKHERYVFQDATGSITVDIDDKLFAGRTVTPQNTVRLHEEVDVEHYGYREIDVDVLEIVK